MGLLLYLHVDPAPVLTVLPKARDVTHIGHWGTGNLEIIIGNMADLDAVKPFINVAYEGRAQDNLTSQVSFMQAFVESDL